MLIDKKRKKKMKDLVLLLSVLVLFVSCTVSLAERVVVIPLGSGNCSAEQTTTKRVFVSSMAYSGNLGGISGADGICNQLAQDAGLTGSYKAWLSGSDSSPATTFTHSNEPYVLVDQTVVADGWDDLTDSTIGHAIHLTEKGTNLLGTVWSNTHPDGSAISSDGTNTCSEFTSAAEAGQGVIGTIALNYSSEWTRHQIQPCDKQAHLYCFEQ